MNPDEGPVNSSSVERSINHIQETFSKEDIFLLLIDDDFWTDFVAKGHVSREEAEQVREGLMAQEILKDMNDADRDEHAQEYREKLWEEFTCMEKELERWIAQLRALADQADEVHRDCTIWNVVASSTGIASGILIMAGIGLTPVTGGMSLGLTAAGLGLGAASAVTDIATSIVEHKKIKAIEDEASKLTSTEVNPEEAFLRFVGDCAPKIVPTRIKVFRGIKGFGKNIRALELISANPQLAARAIRIMNSGKTSARSARHVQQVFKGTALAMSKTARRVGMAAAGVFLLVDVCSFLQQSRHLKEGAKSESARQLRKQATKLERKLEKLKRIHASLLEDELQEPRAECGAEA